MSNIYPHAKRYNKQEIKTEHFIFYCATFNRARYGFAHEVEICPIDSYKTLAEGLARWCNRTWERHEYATAIEDAIEQMPEGLKQLATLEIESYWKTESARLDAMLEAFKTSWSSLPTEQRERIADSVGMVQTKQQFEAVATGVNALAALNELFKE